MIKKYFIFMLLFLVSTATTGIFADDAPSVARCYQYLNQSDAKFAKLARSSGAADAATTLDQCVNYNACAMNINPQIFSPLSDSISQCASKLNQRDLLANYYVLNKENAAQAAMESESATPLIAPSNNSLNDQNQQQQQPTPQPEKKSTGPTINWF